MKNSYFFLLIISLFYSCENDNNQLFSPDNIESQFFQINIATDTTIQAKDGTVLEIDKNTFSSKSGSVKLEVKEVLTKSDIIKSGLFTLAENNEILESDGMLFLDVEPKQEPLKSIKVKMPTSALNPDMQLFELGEDNLWKNPQPLLESPESKRIVSGQNLYNSYCASCHSKDLREDMTGPALGNVHLFRTEEWLRDFTLNSYQMIANLDSMSICIWNNWKPTAMTTFEGILSEKEISDIYFFIKNESRLQKIEKNEVEYVIECDITYRGNPDDPNGGDWGIRSIDAKTNQGRKISHSNSSNGFGFTPFPQTFTDTLQNEFSTGNFGWMNVDYFLRKNEISTEEVDAFKVKINGKNIDAKFKVLVVFRKRNIVIPLNSSSSVTKIYTIFGKEKINMPKGEKIYLVAIGNDYSFGIKQATIGDKNSFELTLKPSSQKKISKFIKSL